MNIAQTIIPLADDGWGMHGGGGGWWIVGAALMMLIMGGMMWMMMRGMGGGSSGSSSAPSESRGSTESPVKILERRLAEGEISIEEYRARRDALLTRSSDSDEADEDGPLTATGAREARER